MLEHLVDRVRACDAIENIVVATTNSTEDDILEKWCSEVGLWCYRGSPNDVLGRLCGAAETFEADLIVEVLGDNPLVHADLVGACLKRYAKTACDYVATVTNEYPCAPAKLKRFPIGIRVQVFPRNILSRCEKLARNPRFREHATSFIAENPDKFNTEFVEANGAFSYLNRPDLTFAVNYRENLALIRRIFETCFPIDQNFSIEMAISAFDSDNTLHALMGQPKI